MSVRGGPLKGQLMTLPRRKAKFLKHFVRTGNQSESLAVAGLAKSTHYKLLENNLKYSEAFRQACDGATDQLVAEARRRAVTGVEEPVGWYKGVAGGTIRRFSDNLLMFLIKERRPEFRDKFELTGQGGQPLQIQVAAYTPPPAPQKGYVDPAPPAKDSSNPEPGPEVPPIEVEIEPGM